MVVLAFIAALTAAILFLVATFNVAAKVNLVAAGLTMLTVAWTVQTCAHNSATRIHF